MKLHLLDKIAKFIFEDTKIAESTTGKYMLPPFTIIMATEFSSKSYVAINVVNYLNIHKTPTKLFKKYCVDTYSLGDSDIDYVWGIYRKELITNLFIDLNEENMGMMYVVV
jgi:hypothetical protein